MIAVEGSAKRPANVLASGPPPGTVVHWVLAQPINDLAHQAEQLGWPILGCVGNVEHLRKHGDHTPWSLGKRPGVIYALDAHPPKFFEPWLVAQCLSSGYDTRWIDFFNINGSQYNGAGRRVGSSTDQHLHISVALGYEKTRVTLFTDFAGEDEDTVDDKTIKAIADAVWQARVTSPSLLDEKTGKPSQRGAYESVINSVTIGRRLGELEKAVARIEQKLAKP